MTQFFILRHGETLWNREHRIQGQGNSELSGAGLRQAAAAARYLATAGCTRLVSSDLGRTVQTALPIAAATGLRIETDAALRERAFGIFEGLTPDQVRERYPDDHASWQLRKPDYGIPGGESLVQLRERVRGAFEALARTSSSKVIVVTHGGVLDALYRIAANVSLDAPRTWQLLNASVNQIKVDEGKWELGAWGDITHLPAVEDDFS